MPVIAATFGKLEDITNPGSDGKVFRFPAELIDRNDIGTPRQPSKTKLVRIRVAVSDGRIQTWGLGQPDDLIKLVKVMFEFTKEHLTTELISGTWTGGDLEVTVDTHTHKGPYPFNPTLIQEPAGAVVDIEVRRPIGFS